jgi:septum formation protein
LIFTAVTGSLSNNSHSVCTGVTLVLKKPNAELLVHSFHESSTVTFGDLSEEVIRAYVETGEPLDKAGSYGIQDLGNSPFATCFFLFLVD